MEADGNVKSKRVAECIRNVSNFSQVLPEFKFDSATFDPSKFLAVLPQASPKLIALLERIAEVDARDQMEKGKVFKHCIYVDNKSSVYGAKLVAAALYARGWKPVFGREGLLTPVGQEGSPGVFGLLCSGTIYGKPMPVGLRKAQVALFNQRPDNIHGEKMRIIVIDQGFREGIDLFDTKYCHIFEELDTHANERQAIGRNTRFCGQAGLEFHPTMGWPLNVFRYRVAVPEELKKGEEGEKGEKGEGYEGDFLFDMYLKKNGIDLSKMVFAGDLDRVVAYAAVDHELTENVHAFSVAQKEGEESALEALVEGAAEASSGMLKKAKDFLSAKNVSRGLTKILSVVEGGARKRRGRRQGKDIRRPKPTGRWKNFYDMRDYIAERFGKYKWPEAKMENLCVAAGGSGAGGAAEVPAFNPTQEFVRNYFQPASFVKGMLLYHSLGTGKTCTAIAAATTGFEPRGYTILWVTRHTLKTDIWKNMFGKVCSATLRNQIRRGEVDADKLPAGERGRWAAPLRHLSKSWMLPVSYKQFSNMLLGRNEVYKELVRRNGATDPLKKTLVIIDEAHKLLDPSLPRMERPNVAVMKERIHGSYATSGKDSVRLLLMSATPYTTDPMQLVALLNLLREGNQQLPEDFAAFRAQYLTDGGKFTKDTALRFMNEVGPYVSYLNREKDARTFAYPVVSNVVVQMSVSDRKGREAAIAQMESELAAVVAALEEGKQAVKAVKAKVRKDTADLQQQRCMAPPGMPKAARKECKAAVAAEMKAVEGRLLAELQPRLDTGTTRVGELKAAIRESRRAAKDKKSDLSQQAALEGKCGI